MIRLKQVLKLYGMKQKELAAKIGITSDALRQRSKNPTLKSAQEIADNIGCELHELFDTSKEYAHWYDKKEWLGIRKK